MNVRLANLLVPFLLAISAIPLAAHHSVAATYDATKAMSITGKVREVRWGNPHTLLSIDFTGADGKAVSWKIEMGGSAIVFKPGFRKEEIFSGPVTLLVWPARDGSMTAAARVLMLPDGRQFDVHDTFAGNNDGKAPPPIKFQDINANHVGFQVRNIDSVYARAKANGAITVSDGGIIDFHGGRAAMIRDSDVGGYILLWQPGR